MYQKWSNYDPQIDIDDQIDDQLDDQNDDQIDDQRRILIYQRIKYQIWYLIFDVSKPHLMDQIWSKLIQIDHQIDHQILIGGGDQIYTIMPPDPLLPSPFPPNI